MTKEELLKLSDEKLKVKAKIMKSASIQTAFIIGFLIGIILYSIFYNSWGLVTLIPLYFIYRLVNDPDDGKVLKEVLKERNL